LHLVMWLFDIVSPSDWWESSFLEILINGTVFIIGWVVAIA